MIQRDERELDPEQAHAAHLARLYTSTPAPHLADAIDRAVYTRMTAQAAPGASKSTAKGRRVTPRLRLASLATAALLMASGVAGYLRLSSPTPAAADTQRI